MAFTFFSGATTVSTSTTISLNIDTNSYSTVAVLCVMTDGAQRVGGEPTFNGYGMNSNRLGRLLIAGGSGSIEVYYLLNSKIPNGGGTFNVPNDNSDSIGLVGSIYNTPDLVTWAKIVTYDDATTGTTSNPSVVVGPYTSDGLVVAGVFSVLDEPEAVEIKIGGGNTSVGGFSAQYYIDTTGTTKTMAWDSKASNWAAQGVAFNEIVASKIFSRDGVEHKDIDGVDGEKIIRLKTIDSVFNSD